MPTAAGAAAAMLELGSRECSVRCWDVSGDGAEPAVEFEGSSETVTSRETPGKTLQK